MHPKFKCHRALLIPVAAAVALLAACSTPPPIVQETGLPPSGIAPPVQVQPEPAPVATGPLSAAPTARAYRKDAAAHLYGLNQQRIYKGRMPPLLHAVGVLQVDVGSKGEVREVSWMRAPRHAPDVMAEIERTVRAAAPFPVPARMGHVVYTDTWLWHKSGRFQLDTLTEGQD
jgi:protein TonB